MMYSFRTSLAILTILGSGEHGCGFAFSPTILTREAIHTSHHRRHGKANGGSSASGCWELQVATDPTNHLSNSQRDSEPDMSSSSSSSPSSSTTTDLATRVKSVNYFISRECNYSCSFCFHTQKNTDMLSLEEAKKGLQLLRDAGTEKINFAGGEPFLNDMLLGELCRYSHELGMAVSIISNGSMIRPYWMKLYGEYVDVLGVSVDSFDPATNAAIGRGGDANNNHAERVFKVREMCDEQNIIFKMNTVVCSLNWEEDLSDFVRKLQPKRWKVFQVLLLKNENSGGPGELRDARSMIVTKDQFWSFIDRHAPEFDQLIPEPNDVMQNSYLLLDEKLRFLDCSDGAKVPSASILEVGVEAAIEQAGFDDTAFHDRGGIYDWTRDREQNVINNKT